MSGKFGYAYVGHSADVGGETVSTTAAGLGYSVEARYDINDKWSATASAGGASATLDGRSATHMGAGVAYNF
ncbi:MAG: hypothetical protein IBX55_01070 [Methyloprofundus sp.]|nr:hypothetical protein [Methyloprofundus sp.]